MPNVDGWGAGPATKPNKAVSQGGAAADRARGLPAARNMHDRRSNWPTRARRSPVLAAGRRAGADKPAARRQPRERSATVDITISSAGDQKPGRRLRQLVYYDIVRGRGRDHLRALVASAQA